MCFVGFGAASSSAQVLEEWHYLSQTIAIGNA